MLFNSIPGFGLSAMCVVTLLTATFQVWPAGGAVRLQHCRVKGTDLPAVRAWYHFAVTECA